VDKFIKKLKLQYRINLVYYISIILVIFLVISFNLISDKINNDLSSNTKNLQSIRDNYNIINKKLRSLNYLTIEHSINKNATYDLSKLNKEIVDTINKIKYNPLIQKHTQIIKEIEIIKSNISEINEIASTYKENIIKDYKSGIYFILGLALSNDIINEELLKLDIKIQNIFKLNVEELQKFILLVKAIMTIFIILIAIFMLYINIKVKKSILSQLKNLQYGVTSFFDLLARNRDELTYLDTSTNDEISQIAKIINDNMNTSKNLIFTERETTNKIEQKIKEATQEIQNLNDEVEATQREVILTLSIIGEERSNETGYHVMRVAEYSLILARLAGLSLEESTLIKSASPMHDIGKIGVPDAVLNKPSGYTPAEYEIMKQHPTIGYRMLGHSNKPILKAAAIISYEHHEKWDGSGYPQGLKGEEIHIYGRITAIADVFDALGSDRVYKKAWELKDIYDLFEKESGKHFDPTLVDLFLDNLEYFIAARENIESKDEEASLSDFIVNFDKVDDIILG